MKELIGICLLLLTIGFLVVVFGGDPDIADALRMKITGACKP